MKNRDITNTVIDGLHRKHRLLAAFLEASGKIDSRILQRQAAIGDMSQPVNVEAHQQASTAPKSPVPPFAFRRANLAPISE